MDTFTPYLESIEDAAKRKRVEDVLTWVASTYPTLEHRIAWSQPMFTDHGTFIIAFSVAAGHLAVAPEKAALDKFRDELTAKGLKPTKMLFRFVWEKAVDYELLAKIIDFNITDKKDCVTFWRKE